MRERSKRGVGADNRDYCHACQAFDCWINGNVTESKFIATSCTHVEQTALNANLLFVTTFCVTVARVSSHGCYC